MKNVLVTGADGLLGWHTRVRLHAANCMANFRGDPSPYKIIPVNHSTFDDELLLKSAVKRADAILHFAAINRSSNKDIELENRNISHRLIEACEAVNVNPHIVYANSIHAFTDTIYGISKRKAGEILESYSARYTNLILPHIFGEGARPFYNNVTATLIHQIIKNEVSNINPNGEVELLHAGCAAFEAINSINLGITGQVQPVAKSITVPDLFEKLKCFHESYQDNRYPDFSCSIDLDLFNSYRSATFPDLWPRFLEMHTDPRGSLFEAVKGGGGGQTFLSTTKPGVTRGNHFHLNKVERFLVVRGDAIIRVRKVMSSKVWEFRVSGNKPTAIDMPTLHTHSIENVGKDDLVTLFWTQDLFDPGNTDTYADEVLS